jgi:hypothetical protein
MIYGVVGSTAYGLAGSGSDVDRLGVYVAPTRDVLGLNGARATDASLVSTDPDSTLHELGKFCRLALKSNPTIIELLFLASYDLITDEGRDLVALRDAFLSEGNVRSSYAGYAHQQVERLVSRRARHGGDDSRVAKHGRHCVRLLRQGAALLSSGTLTLDVSTEREHIFAAGALAATDPDAFYRLYEAERRRFDATVSVLAAEVDRERVDDFVTAVRVAHMPSH